MTLFAWFVFFLAIQIVHYLGTWKLYEKAGRKSWEAAIPVYNSIVLMKIINRPSWWTILLFIPVINLIMFPVVWVETIRSFGKKSALDTILVLATLGLYIYYINYTQNVTHIKDRSLISSSKAGDTISSLLFAVVVATLVHTYVMQPYTIPTSSLEKSLLVGDFLFVSKFHYGARTPMTTFAAPMVHDTLPLVNKKSYTIWPQLPYFRLPGFEKIANSDIVVFNWPADTLYHMYRPADKRYEKPIDKKTNYVKRCVGIPGDNLSIKDGIVYINDKELQLPERAKPQYSYWLGYDGKTPIDFDFLLKDMKVTDGIFYVSSNRDSIGLKALTKENVERFKNMPGITSVTRMVRKGAEDGIYPDPQDGIVSKTSNWNCDNFGPIYIPKAGVTVALDLASLPLYKKIITEYEKGNVLKVVGNDIYINNKIVKSYTFQQNYYWMMGDNRHNSLDARYFGFTPEDHIVGKPVFIWMSWDTNGKGFGKIRWDRLFTTVGGDGQPTSYFKIFLILLALYIAIDYGIKKRNAKKNS